MDKHTFIEFAKDIYKFTLLFPKRDPLRVKLRQAADDVVEEMIMKRNDYLNAAGRLLELAEGYCEIVIEQNWMSATRVTAVKEKCRQLARELKETVSDEEKIPSTRELGKTGDVTLLVPEHKPAPEIIIAPPESKPCSSCALGREKREIESEEEAKADDGAPFLTAAQIERQTLIMEFLKEKGNAQVWEIQKIFPRVSKRTIRRDFASLLEQGLIERTGERNTTAYKPKVNLS